MNAPILRALRCKCCGRGFGRTNKQTNKQTDTKKLKLTGPGMVSKIHSRRRRDVGQQPPTSRLQQRVEGRQCSYETGSEGLRLAEKLRVEGGCAHHYGRMSRTGVVGGDAWLLERCRMPTCWQEGVCPRPSMRGMKSAALTRARLQEATFDGRCVGQVNDAQRHSDKMICSSVDTGLNNSIRSSCCTNYRWKEGEIIYWFKKQSDHNIVFCVYTILCTI